MSIFGCNCLNVNYFVMDFQCRFLDTCYLGLNTIALRRSLKLLLATGMTQSEGKVT